jgi:hypothetical protein
MTSRDLGFGVALSALALVILPGCWPAESEAPPPFDCSTIDRAAERFPDECGDAGVPEDAGVPSDGGEDAGP